MEYMGAGNLYDYVHNPVNHVDWAFCIRVITGIANAINFLHRDYRMIHRDLKSPNILVNLFHSSLFHLIFYYIFF
jgi:serine/threonine protein kinase